MNYPAVRLVNLDIWNEADLFNQISPFVFHPSHLNKPMEPFNSKFNLSINIYWIKRFSCQWYMWSHTKKRKFWLLLGINEKIYKCSHYSTRRIFTLVGIILCCPFDIMFEDHFIHLRWCRKLVYFTYSLREYGRFPNAIKVWKLTENFQTY